MHVKAKYMYMMQVIDSSCATYWIASIMLLKLLRCGF